MNLVPLTLMIWEATMSNPKIVLVLACLLVRCSAEVDAPGVCKLDCSSAVPATPGTTIQFIGFASNEKLSLGCEKTAGNNYYAAVPIHFMIQKPATKLPAETIPGDAEHLPPADVGNTRDTTTALAGISFDISVLAGSMANKKNPSNPADQYKGILTSQDKWCTDSCGVGFVEIVPRCELDVNDVWLLVRSGAAAASKFNITVNP
jgi:hypothetical protein